MTYESTRAKKRGWRLITRQSTGAILELRPSPRISIVICGVCGTDKEREFNGEIAIHFPGLKGLGMPIVWVFPKLLVCLNCGAAQFQVPEKELHTLGDDGAVASSL